MDLQRFVDAQENVYGRVLAELRRGRKTSHWMWFIFPQISGLGHSDTAKFYSIKNIDEAKEYLAHPVLGPRLLECCQILLEIPDCRADEIFGYPDNVKLRSCITLFQYIAPQQKEFSAVLEKYFEGPDGRTLELVEGRRG